MDQPAARLYPRLDKNRKVWYSIYRLAVTLAFDGAMVVSLRNVAGEPNLILWSAFSWQSDYQAQTTTFLCTRPFAIGYGLAHGNQESVHVRRRRAVMRA